MSNEVVAVGEATLLRHASDKFESRFGRRPVGATCAPGRVNLIGEHIDYCEGFVLPVALPFVTLVVGAPNTSKTCTIVTVLATGETLEASFPAPSETQPLKPGVPAWANYVKGVVANFPGPVEGFDAVIVSDVPMGAGLSSSASLEVAMFTLLERLTSTTVDPVQKAMLCQKAEHEFPGMPCGIMDQYIVTMGKKGHALLIDCRSLESTQIPMEVADAVILVVNSNVKHQLTGSEYPQRRAQCQEAADKLGKPSLRTARIEDLKELERLNCDKLVIMRAKHVIEEIHRTEEVAKSLTQKDLKRVGEMFYQSHDSLSTLMEVSCPELDQLVDILRGRVGVYGARMTGGGFGGCVIALMQSTTSINSTSYERDTPTPNRSDSDRDILNYSDNERDTPTPNRSTPTPISSHRRPRKNKLTKEVLKSVNYHFKRPKQPDNRFEVFGKNVGMKLQELPKEQGILAEKIINETLFLAEMGSLTLSHTVRENDDFANTSFSTQPHTHNLST
ncbi:hypothetical protein evm_009410 [Chilo suppressalis]|nr:hypothetical protein evm_009410 [Chilo suppressalis]